MSQAEALLNAVSEPTAGTASEGNIVVGRDRYIVVPESLKKIGVQYDHDVETVTFDCPRYWDNWDFSKMKIYVNYMRSDGALGAYLCENVVVDSSNDELIHFDWTISGNVTHVAGVVSFIVCIKNVDADGKELTHWNSELNTDMHVSAGLKCQETVLRRYPDIITQLLVRMDQVEVDNEAWKKETYAEMDRRIDDVEETVSHNSLTGKINECLRTEESTQELIEDIVHTNANEYLESNRPLAYAVHSIVDDYIRDDVDAAINLGKESHKALSYKNYREMVYRLNSYDNEELTVGQSIYIATNDVPDVWVYSVDANHVYFDDTTDIVPTKNTRNQYVLWGSEEYQTLIELNPDIYVKQTVISVVNTNTPYLDESRNCIKFESELGQSLLQDTSTYTTIDIMYSRKTDDNLIINNLKSVGYVKIGYYKIALLETEKVDLTTIESDISILKDRTAIKRYTLSAGNSTIGIIDANITENSVLTFFTSIYGVNPTSIQYGNGYLTVKFYPQEVDMEVGVRVDG